ncbi:MAG: putative rane protein [Pseudomonadota bacterium]|jgi:hypothetical protein
MIWLLLGVLALVLLLTAGTRISQMDPRYLAQGLKFAAVAAASLLMLRSGRLGFLLLPALQQWIVRQMGNPFAGSGPKGFGPAPGAPRNSGGPDATRVQTATLGMELDHASGTVDGEVLTGRFRGKRLAELSVAQVMDLLADCQRTDAESVPLLEAYLDRREPDWRSAAEPPRGSGGAAMSREEALSVLGLADGATRDDIKAAHHRLMKKLHPDQGGSNHLASQVNQAKDLLLRD